VSRYTLLMWRWLLAQQKGKTKRDGSSVLCLTLIAFSSRGVCAALIASGAAASYPCLNRLLFSISSSSVAGW
jgi:hypothetical protein